MPEIPVSRQRKVFAGWMVECLLIPMMILGMLATPVVAAENLLPPSKVEAINISNPAPPKVEIPQCGSRNIDGRLTYENRGNWTVTSSIGSGSTVFVGTTWTVEALIDVWAARVGGIGNDGPDPLRLVLPPGGPVKNGASPQGFYDARNNRGSGWVGALGNFGPFGYRFDANSDPKWCFDVGCGDAGDGAYARLTVTLEATGPGTIGLPEFVVSGYDGTPIADSFSCALPLNWSWNVVLPGPPSVNPESVTVDARYPGVDPNDRNGGVHRILIDVLANDDDPNIPGGPGDLSQVRLASWQTSSAMGGVVNCGAPALNGAPADTPFTELATGPCLYEPPLGYEGPDAFSYTVRSVSGTQQATAAGIIVRPNRRPAGTDVQFGTAVNTEATFNLAAGISDLDGDPLTCSLAAGPNPSVGDVTIAADCSTLEWENPSPGFTGTVSLDYRVCDTHPLLVEPALGANVVRAANYNQGSPPDLSATTARRCSVATAAIIILPGMVIPPVGVTDTDRVDAGYLDDGIGPYTIRIPVLDNDFDGNGPDPQLGQINGEDVLTGFEILNPPDPTQGTALIVGDRVVFTPADGFSGPVEMTYRICENPVLQDPPYFDDPDTPFIDEGLPFCGVGTVRIDVIGNAPPEAQPDLLTVGHDDIIEGADLAANDTDPEGTELVCTADTPEVSAPELVASVSIGADCRLDFEPVNGAEGEVSFEYQVCDSHLLTVPDYPQNPYGSSDGRLPGDPAPRCTTGTVTVTILGPGESYGDPLDNDPPPVCVDDTASTFVGQAVQIFVTANDSDFDDQGQPGPVILTGPIAEPPFTSDLGATVGMNPEGTALLYQPGSVGVDVFAYTARDTVGQGCSAMVRVTVAQAPVAVPALGVPALVLLLMLIGLFGTLGLRRG
jgi:hypothetical protein